MTPNQEALEGFNKLMFHFGSYFKAEHARTIRALLEEENGEILFGQNCPKGKVQLEFVSVSGGERKGRYQYTPSDSAFLEIYVDGERFRLDVGDLTSHGSEGKRGIHVCGPIRLKADRTAINAVNLYGEDQNAQS